jgi:hypothetical protein
MLLLPFHFIVKELHGCLPANGQTKVIEHANKTTSPKDMQRKVNISLKSFLIFLFFKLTKIAIA